MRPRVTAGNLTSSCRDRRPDPAPRVIFNRLGWGTFGKPDREVASAGNHPQQRRRTTNEPPRAGGENLPKGGVHP